MGKIRVVNLMGMTFLSSVLFTNVSDMKAFAEEGTALKIESHSTANTVASGVAGTVSWKLYSDGRFVLGEGILNDETPWYKYSNLIDSIEFTGKVTLPKDCNYFFYSMPYLEKIIGLNNLDGKKVENVQYMFFDLPSLKEVDFSNFDVGQTESLSEMFVSLDELKVLKLNNWKNSNVTSTRNMFLSSPLLEKIELKGFNTSKVKEMAGMFQDLTSLKSLDLTSFNTKNVESMAAMFYDTNSLTTLNLPDGFIGSKNIDVSSMFKGTKKLKKLNLSNTNSSNVLYMDSMFQEAESIVSLNLSSFNTSKVINMSSMFQDMTALTDLNISNFETSNVEEFVDMFNNVSKIKNLDLSHFNTIKAQNMNSMLNNMDSLLKLNISNFNTRNSLPYVYDFLSSKSLKEISLGKYSLINLNLLKNTHPDFNDKWVGKNSGKVFNSTNEFIQFVNSNDTKNMADTYNLSKQVRPEVVFNYSYNIPSKTIVQKNDESKIDRIIPKRNGYRFIDWYRDKELTKKYNFNTIVKTNLNLFAKWTKVNKVSFDSNGGSKINYTQVDNKSLLIAPKSPTKKGYKFLGWHTDSKLTKKYNFNSKVTKNITLYAKWQRVYTVTFNSNKGSKVTNQTILSSNKVKQPTTPTKKGYKFVGWYTDSKLTKKYNFNNKVIKNVTLYAKWKK